MPGEPTRVHRSRSPSAADIARLSAAARL